MKADAHAGGSALSGTAQETTRAHGERTTGRLSESRGHDEVSSSCFPHDIEEGINDRQQGHRRPK